MSPRIDRDRREALTASAGVILQNDPDDPPALLGEWLRKRKIPFETIKMWDTDIPRDPLAFAWIVALGSHNSVTDAEPGWIGAEVELMRRAVAEGVPVLGICFGGQALAAALGGEIFPADPPSVGWLETRTFEPDLVPAGPWIYLNSERFSVPEGATLVARLPEAPSAFRFGPHLGVQFHPEATTSMASRWVDHYAEWLRRQGFSPERICDDGRTYGLAAARQAFALFDAWFAGAARCSRAALPLPR